MNISKGTTGGTVQPGDTLEIRASVVVKSGTYDSCAFFDVVPAGTTYIAGTIRVLTNEGMIYKQLTDAYGDDPGWISGSNIQINLGYGASAPATAFRRGRIKNTYKPSFYGSTCLTVASYRVQVTAGYGTNLSIGGGSISYKPNPGSLSSNVFPTITVQVYNNNGLCSNSVGTNSIGTEFNGTFGTGQARNRGPSANVPSGYTYATFDLNMPNDYYYGVANNTSTAPAYTTTNSWAIPDGSSPTHRVFSVWDVIGDHTGAVSPSLGNPPADTVANPNAGYMLVVNSAYRIDSAFQQTISGLCPSTYYEVSAWIRNMCSHCGCDSNGVGASSGGYIPTGPGDSSGVHPNISFRINGIDYYTTGNILYTGTWVKKGVTYLTGAAQTSFTVQFFNNAPGGGGNDWAMDDISVATCTPTHAPSQPTVTVCKGNTASFADTVKSFFNNYVYYQWQKSTDNGVTWVNDGASGGPASPTQVSGNWQYTVTHTPFVVNTSDSGTLYRLVVATTAANLTTAGCYFAGPNILIKVINCGPPLAINLLSFTGKLVNNNAVLNWTTSREDEAVKFIVEKSTDGLHFSEIGTINGFNDPSADINTYSFTDPTAVDGVVYYRIKMVNNQNLFKYSRTIQLNSKNNEFSFGAVINPFNQHIEFQLLSSLNGKVEVQLINSEGRIVRRGNFILNSGLSALSLDNTGILSTGIYTLRACMNEKVIQKIVMKTENQ